MKKIKSYLKNPMLIIFVLILIIFTPQGLYSPGQSRNVGVVVAMGIDKAQEGYEVSLLTFIPKPNQTFKEVDSVVSGKAENVAKALYNAQIALGRRVGLSHVKTTVLSEELMREDVTGIVDYLTRLAALSSSTVFIGTNTSAKELLSLSSKLENGIGLDIEQLIGFNSDKLFVSETSLEEFYRGYYGREKASLIGFLPVVEGDTDSKASIAAEGESAGGGSLSESGSEGGGGSSKGGEEKGKYILNRADSILLKDGKMATILSLDEVNSINLLNANTRGQIVRIKDALVDGVPHDLTYRIREKTVKATTSFEGGYPVFSAKIALGMELMEINGDHEGVKVRSEYSKLTPEIVAKIDQTLQEDFQRVLSVLREYGADVLGVGNKFFKENRDGYQKFIQALEKEDEFIKQVIFKLNFDIEPN